MPKPLEDRESATPCRTLAVLAPLESPTLPPAAVRALLRIVVKAHRAAQVAA